MTPPIGAARQIVLARVAMSLILIVVVLPWAEAAMGADTASEASKRFELILNDEAVKDQRSGLVWERALDSFYGTWTEAIEHCRQKRIGGQGGWRLPDVKELSSLLDRTQKDPALPIGHPFENVKSSIFWTATPSESDDIVAWHVSFFSGEAVTDQKSQTRRAWCARDPEGTPQ